MFEIIGNLFAGPLAEALGAIGSVAGGGALIGSALAAAISALVGEKRAVVLEKAALGGLLGGILAVLLVAALNLAGLD